MRVIGIESSAHTFGVGIVDDGKILAKEKEMFHIGTTGMIPAEVAEFHTDNAAEVINRALKSANLNYSDIEGIGYTRGPGLGPCLQVGYLSAKTLAKKLKVPIAPVNHGVAHIESTRLISGMKDPIALYVSGGNSQILKMDNKPFKHYRVLGETFDIGVGNMLDSFARELKLTPSWGSSIEKKASGGKYVEMPYSVKGMDFSFTGLLTKAVSMIPDVPAKDLCFSIQEAAFSMLAETTERALLLTNSDEICVCGGVAQNSRLKQILNLVAKEHGARFGFIEGALNADNGAMIAMVAERMLLAGHSTSIDKCDIEQRFRVDSAEVF